MRTWTFPAVLAAGLLAACGGDDPPPREPAPQRPVVRLATKNFTEQFILGHLYKQALEARGFRVALKENVGSSEIVDEALEAGGIDMYPEYMGVIVGELAGGDPEDRPRTADETYARAKAYEERRGFTLLRRSPGADADANAVLPRTARRYGLRSTADLEKLGTFRYGGPPENETRFQGAVGMREVYGLDGLQYVPLQIPDRYEALETGAVDVIAVFTTEAQLQQTDKYRVLSDPEGIFGFQNIVPVVSRRVLREQGPRFAATVDAVTRLLTNSALRRMNGAVDLDGRRPADVAREFLRAHGLLD